MLFKPSYQVVGEACIVRAVITQDDINIIRVLLGIAGHAGKLIQEHYMGMRKTTWFYGYVPRLRSVLTVPITSTSLSAVRLRSV